LTYASFKININISVCCDDSSLPVLHVGTVCPDIIGTEQRVIIYRVVYLLINIVLQILLSISNDRVMVKFDENF